MRRTVVEMAIATLIVGGILAGLAWWMISLGHALIIRETEQELRSLALMAAGRIDGDDVATVRATEDKESESFKRLLFQLSRIQTSHPELRWVYVMYYTGRGDDWRVVADAQAYALDTDEDGEIEPGEEATEPGDLYEADFFQQSMERGLRGSSTDMTPLPDPPWGVTVSGFAPVYDSAGEVQGVLGLDMMYDNVVRKLDAVTIAVIGTVVLVGFLLLYTFYLFRRRTWAYRQMVELQHQLLAVGRVYAKFVPEHVRRELEAHPDGSSLERTEKDVSIMFVDIVGFTRLSERLPGESLAPLVERVFSRFIEVIHRLGGQVNETAGDGLMIIFEHDPPTGHATDAVRAAIAIQRMADELNENLEEEDEHTLVNVGINSGPAFVGLNRFRSITGERVTYTATGPTTNVAARVAGLAKNGDILLSEETAERIRGVIETERVGMRSLKNVSRPMMIYRPVGTVHSGRVDPAVSGVDPIVDPETSNDGGQDAPADADIQQGTS